MAEHNAFYQKARYYDVVFDRDVSGEVDFILDAYERYAGKKAESALDIACGPAYHALDIAHRGLVSAGLDLHPEMVKMANERAVQEGVSLNLLAADMRDFKLDAPVDAAYIIFDGLDALLLNEDLVKHFKAVAKNLTPNGIYIIDLTHPRDCSLWDYGKFHYKGKRDGTAVEIKWATNKPVFDVCTGVANVDIEIHVVEQGKKQVIKDSARERYLPPQEIQLLADLSGVFKVAGWHGDFNIDQPLDNSDASRRMIAVLQKIEQDGQRK
ncbi:MAG: class I SAM-dependent methyltransferase [Anaerolineae bacterium]|nr:class I SAM-dependent methyltransferase [Anaerolineae bacterium]